MKALKHLKNRFEYAIKGSGSIKINQHDIEALNTLIKEENENKRNTDLEDSLILFYLLLGYKIQNQDNKAKIALRNPDEIKFPLGMPEVSSILNKLSTLISPKQQIIQMIADELWLYQEYERIPKNKDQYLSELKEGLDTYGRDVIITKQEMIPIAKEDRITFEEVESLVNKALVYAKDKFPMLNALDSDFIKFLDKPISRMV